MIKQPKKGEHWHVNITKLSGDSNNKIVKVIENVTLVVPNWRSHKYLVDMDSQEVWLSGMYFVECFLHAEPELRVFSNPVKPWSK